MLIELHKLTDSELAKIVSIASAELHKRLDKTPLVHRLAGAARAVITIQEPSFDDKAFVLKMKAHVKLGKYIKASERERVALIAEKFSDWVKRQEMPTSSGTGQWRKAAQDLAGAAPAAER